MADRNNGTGIWAALVFGGIVASPGLYLLLLGPAWYLVAHEMLPDVVWNVGAYPLRAWEEHVGFGSPPNALWWRYFDYLAWWGFPI